MALGPFPTARCSRRSPPRITYKATRVGSTGQLLKANWQRRKAILKHIRNGDLSDGFTARDVHQKGWAHLAEREHVGAGLNLLVDLDYLATFVPGKGAQVGRVKVTYLVNPRSLG